MCWLSGSLRRSGGSGGVSKAKSVKVSANPSRSVRTRVIIIDKVYYYWQFLQHMFKKKTFHTKLNGGSKKSSSSWKIVLWCLKEGRVGEENRLNLTESGFTPLCTEKLEYECYCTRAEQRYFVRRAIPPTSNLTHPSKFPPACICSTNVC